MAKLSNEVIEHYKKVWNYHNNKHRENMEKLRIKYETKKE